MDNIKFFRAPHRGRPPESCSDHIATNIERRRYALSDGVSQSFLPRIMSAVVAQMYIEGNKSTSPFYQDIEQRFDKAKIDFLQTIAEVRKRERLAKIEALYEGKGAATLVGVELRDNDISYSVIGDSCLFIVFEDNSLKCICSNEQSIENDALNITFDNYPNFILSDGTTKGELLEGTIPGAFKWILMMSDAMSKWFIDTYNRDGDAVIERIFSIENDEEFDRIVDEEFRSQRLDDDDQSILIVKWNKVDSTQESSDCQPHPTQDGQTSIKESPNNTLTKSFSNLVKRIKYTFSKTKKCIKLRK